MNLLHFRRIAFALSFLCATPALAQEWLGRTALSPRGDRLVATSAGIQHTGVWDWRTRKLMLPLKDLGFFGSPVFLADGSKLAYGSRGDKFRLIELPGGKDLPAPAIKDARGRAFVKGDTRLLAWGEKKFVLWNLADGKELLAWPYEDEGLHTLSPDGKMLALVQKKDGRSLKLIDLGTTKDVPVPKLQGVWYVSYQEDGARLGVYTEDSDTYVRQFVLLEAATGKELARHKIAGYGRALALSPDGKTVFVASEGVLELRNAMTWQRERAWGETRGAVELAAFSPDGRWLAHGVAPDRGGGNWHFVVVRELASGRERALFNFSDINSLSRLQFAAGGKVLLASNGVYSVVADLGRLEQTVLSEDRHDGPVMSLAASPDGKWLATGGLDRTVRIWDAATGRLEATLLGHRGLVLGVAFSADGKTLASGSADNTVRLWDVPSGKFRSTLKDHTDAVCALAFHGNLLAGGSVDGTVKLWDIDKRGAPTTFRLPGENKRSPSVAALAFSPDGSRLAVSGGDPFGKSSQTLLIYEVQTGKASQPWKDANAAGCLLWSRDGKRIVTGGCSGNGGRVQLGNVETGKIEKAFDPHRQQGSLALAWHGKAVAVGTGHPRSDSSGGAVRLWDPQTGEPLGSGLPLPGAAMSLAPLPGGRLAIGGHDGSVLVWTLPKE